MVLEVDTKRILLYGKTEVKYTDVSLSAPYLVFDQQSQVVTARMGRDSTGTVTGMAKLVQDQTTTVSDSIRFNFKSQKGLTYNSFFQQDEIYNFAEKVKKMDAETFFAYRGRFTTCNLRVTAGAKNVLFPVQLPFFPVLHPFDLPIPPGL